MKRLPLLLLLAALLTCWVAQAEPPKKPQDARVVNRLAKETSPYLLQHAHNPVNWFPWGEEALEKAKKEGKPIFLSIGYSSCHWCHVMERESFVDDEIAAFLNKHFVCIKVDREERPDVDEIYMTAVQIINRRGGWPLSVFLTPEAKPFYGGTYFPPRDKQIQPPAGAKVAADEIAVMPGFLKIIQIVEQKWRESPQEIKDGADQMAGLVRQALRRSSLAPVAPLDARALEEVQTALADQYDATYGGFGYSEGDDSRTKFPEPSNLTFLLDRARRTKDAKAQAMAVGTLEKMAAGGICDQLGGGFHRYSTDRFWRIPHFEKMLYDNAQLATVYSEAFALTGRTDFKRVVDDLLAFVSRELADAGGGFYTALDADSEGHEGKFYVWGQDEVRKLLTKDELELAAVYGLSGPANFEGHWTLTQTKPITDALAPQLEPVRQKMLVERAKRPRPITDVKVLTSCNGLMIAGFADAGRLTSNSQHTQAAVRAAEFVLSKLRTNDGRLLHTYAAGEAKLNAYVDDYAFLVDGLIALHRATGDSRWLAAADELTTKQIELFWDKESGGFFFTSSDHETLIARSKDPVDSAIPSANAVSAGNLVYLAKALNKPEYLDRAEQTINTFASFLNQSPSAMPRMAQSLAAWLEAKGK